MTSEFNMEEMLEKLGSIKPAPMCDYLAVSPKTLDLLKSEYSEKVENGNMSGFALVSSEYMPDNRIFPVNPNSAMIELVDKINATEAENERGE